MKRQQNSRTKEMTDREWAIQGWFALSNSLAEQNRYDTPDELIESMVAFGPGFADAPDWLVEGVREAIIAAGYMRPQ
jgi:hypothetical protein